MAPNFNQTIKVIFTLLTPTAPVSLIFNDSINMNVAVSL